jgi:hypothetical protein
VVSSLVPEHVVNLTTLVHNHATERSAFTDRMPPLSPSLMHRVHFFYFTLSPKFDLLMLLQPDVTLG